MNKKELAIGVYKHPIIQEILKKEIVDPSVINRLTVEEVDDEDIDYDRFDYSNRIEGEDHNRSFDVIITKFRLKEEVQKEEVQEVSER